MYTILDYILKWRTETRPKVGSNLFKEKLILLQKQPLTL